MDKKSASISLLVVSIRLILMMTVSSAGTRAADGATPILTVNGLSAAEPLIIQGEDELIIRVAGAEVNEQTYSVVCEGEGVLELLAEPNSSVDEPVPAYRFLFGPDPHVGEIMLVAVRDMVIDGTVVSAGSSVYKLVLFYCADTDITTVIGINFEVLSRPPSPPQTEQKIFVSQDSGPEKDYLAAGSGGRASGLDGFPEPDFYPNLNGDAIVNFADFALFAGNWRESGSGLGGDFDDSGAVDINDLEIFAYFWLNGPHPVDVFGMFKTALTAGDVNEALTYVTEISREKYDEIFAIIEPNLPDFAAGMGALTFERQRNGEVIYEMLHQDGSETYSFPVFFIRDEDGNWRLLNF